MWEREDGEAAGKRQPDVHVPTVSSNSQLKRDEFYEHL